MSKQRKPRQKKCRAEGCENTFEPFNSMQSWCSPECGTKIALAKLEKKQKADKAKIKRERIQMKKEFKLKDKPYQTKLTQAVFNKWIRLRDSGEPCISCGITYGKMEAGHYRSRGAAPELRFEPLNVHAQCSQCNNPKSGNIGPYRVGLIKKIGLEQVEWVEGPHDAKKYTCEDLIEIRAHYSKLIREIEDSK